MERREGKPSYTAVVLCEDDSLGGPVWAALNRARFRPPKVDGDAVGRTCYRTADEFLEDHEKGCGASDFSRHIILFVAGEREILTRKRADELKGQSDRLAVGAGGARRALLVVGERNADAKRSLDASSFFRVVDSHSLRPKSVGQVASGIAAELRQLDRAAANYMTGLGWKRRLRHLLGTAVCLVDHKYRLWAMDSVHLGMTGGGPLLGQKCWHAFHASWDQHEPCLHCAVAEFLGPRPCPRKSEVGEARCVASQVANRLRHFLVSGKRVYPTRGKDVLLAAEFSCDITDTPHANWLPDKNKLRLLLDAAISRGFDRARVYTAKGESTLRLEAWSGYRDERGPKVRKVDSRDDRYCMNSLVVAKKPQVYSEDDLGKEEFRKVLDKQDVDFWLEIPFYSPTDSPTGLLAIDVHYGSTRDKHIKHLLEVQDIADSAAPVLARMSWLPRVREDLRGRLLALVRIGYDQVSLWDVLDDSQHTVRGRMWIEVNRRHRERPREQDITGVSSFLYDERFLYEAGVLRRIPWVFERTEVKEGSEVLKDHVAGGSQVMVVPLFKDSGHPMGFLMVSNPTSGRRLDESEIARVAPFALALGVPLEQSQSFLRAYSIHPAPVLVDDACLQRLGSPRGRRDPIVDAVRILALEAMEHSDASGFILRVLRRGKLCALAAGFNSPAPERGGRKAPRLDLRNGDKRFEDVEVHDLRSRCAQALRGGGYSVEVDDLLQDESYEECLRRNVRDEGIRSLLRKAKSMLVVPMHDPIGTLGTMELYSEKARHFAKIEKRDWVQSLTQRLASVLRAFEMQSGEPRRF